MNKKVLKVLSYIGVGLLGAFLGMGALIGVSSCAQKRDDHTQINKKAVMPKRSVYNDDNKVNMNNLEDGYMLTFKIDFYDITKDFQRWYNQESWTIDLNPNNAYSNWQSNGDALWRVYSFDFSWYGDQLWLDYHYLDGADMQTINIFNYAEGSNNHWLVNDNCKTFWIKDFNEVTNGAVFENFFKSIFDIQRFESKSLTFSFINSFNYNSPYSTEANSTFIADSTFTTSNTSAVVIKNYDVGFFRSGNQLFDTILLYYRNGFGTRYLKTTSSVATLDVAGFGYFESMIYLNSLDGASKVVATRLFGNLNDANGNVQTYLANGVLWQSSSYQKLQFYCPYDEAEASALVLSMFNNDSVNTLYYVDEADVGLSNVFNLLSHAFTSIIPLMAIQIIPGITIGLLLFMPLIVMVIVGIIWLVKR